MSSYATDSFVFNESLKSATVQEPFDNKQYLKIHDLNNGIYANDIRFETSGVSQTSAYGDYARGLIHIPLCVGVYGSDVGGGNPVDFTAANVKESDMMLCIKNSFTTLIERIQVRVDGQELVSQCNNINEVISYKMNTEMTMEEELLWGDSIGYAIDDGMVFNTAAVVGTGTLSGSGLSGYGYCSNNNALQNPTACRNLEFGKSMVFNSGAFKRSARYTSMVETNGTVKKTFTDKTYSDIGVDAIENLANCKKYYINAIIRLKDLPFFENLPLMKGSLLQITLYVNQGSFTVSKSAEGILQCTNVRSSGSTNPVMFNAGWVIQEGNVAQTTQTHNTVAEVGADASNGFMATRCVACGSSNLPVSKVYEVSWGIARCTLNSGAINVVHPMQTARLLIPMINLNPSFEQTYLNLRTKKHIYHDYVLSSVDVAPNQSINKYVTSKSRITRIIVVPKLNGSAHGVNTTGSVLVDPSLSPFSSCPATPSPLLNTLITNLNIEVGGVNIFREPMQYSYEQWLFEQFHSSNNGGFTNLTSGRITKTMYDNLHGVIVANVRRNDITRNSELKVQISLTSLCKLPMTLDIFVQYERSSMIDVLTGKIYDIV